MSYESIHTVITPSTTKQMINTSNKDPCSYHKSAVNTPLTNSLSTGITNTSEDLVRQTGQKQIG